MSKNPDPWPKGRYLRLGAPTGRFPDGYADDPACGSRGEPECLDEADHDRYIAPRASQDAAKRLLAEQEARDKDRRLLSQEERITRAMREAREKRRDVSREVAFLRNMQAKRRAPDAIEKRVQTLERIVYLGRAA
jgi:hypothetical protein